MTDAPGRSIVSVADASDPAVSLAPRVRQLRDLCFIALARRAALPVPTESDLAAMPPNASLAVLWEDWVRRHPKRTASRKTPAAEPLTTNRPQSGFGWMARAAIGMFTLPLRWLKRWWSG